MRVGELDHALAEVGLDDLHSERLQVGVELDLLAGHRLDLGDDHPPPGVSRRASRRRCAQMLPMISRASAASFAKCTTPPAASILCLNWSASSGRWSRLACRRCFSSARPLVEVETSRTRGRGARECRSARWSALAAGWGCREPCRRASRSGAGSQARAFEASWRASSSAAGVDTGAKHMVPTHTTARLSPLGSITAYGCASRAARTSSRFPRAHLDRCAQAIQRAREGRRHQAVLSGQAGDRLEGAASSHGIRHLGLAGENVELGQRHRGDGVLAERLDRDPRAGRAPRPRGRNIRPARGRRTRSSRCCARSSAIGSQLSPRPAWCARTAASSPQTWSPSWPVTPSVWVRPSAGLVPVVEEPLEQLCGVLAKRRAVAQDGGVEVGHGERRHSTTCRRGDRRTGRPRAGARRRPASSSARRRPGCPRTSRSSGRAGRVSR